MNRKATTRPGRKPAARSGGAPHGVRVGGLSLLGLLLAVGLVVLWMNRSPRPAAVRSTTAGVGPGAGANSSSGLVETHPPPAGRSDREQSTALANDGNRRLQAGDAPGAETAYRAALKLAPGDEDLHYNLGIALARQNRVEEAEAAYREALKLYPEYPEVHNNLGNLLSRQKRFDEAITHFREAIRQQPEYASAHNNYGIALQQLGRAAEAFTQFQKAVETETNYWEARFNLGNSAAALGQEPLAIESYNAVLRQRPDFEPARRALEALVSKQAAGKPSAP